MVSKYQQPQPVVPLRTVLKLINEDKFRLTDRASESAMIEFGWDDLRVKEALLKLRQKHFYKQDARRTYPYIDMDFYKARMLLDSYDVYIHMYMDSNGYIVVDSFKPLEKGQKI
jgi:hypothetical protein